MDITVCLEYKHSYCVFDSKLARILQVEGRLAQGINPQAFGTAEAPRCAGFSVDEMQRLDLSLMDFINPIYPYPSNDHVREAGIVADINPNLPNASATTKAINDRIQAQAVNPS